MKQHVKIYKTTIGKIALATSLITAIASSNLMAAECEVSGTNLIYAYSRAVNNGAKFSCRGNNGNRFVQRSGLIFIPLPTMMQCLNKKNGLYPNKQKFRMLAFNKPGNWPLNGWKLSQYQMTGGGDKISTRSGGIVFQTEKWANRQWSILLKKIWLKKKGGSCSNIRAVIEQAYGR